MPRHASHLVDVLHGPIRSLRQRKIDVQRNKLMAIGEHGGSERMGVYSETQMIPKFFGLLW